MSEDSQLITASLNVELLLCSMCRGFLSCGPIRVLPDGSDVCGRCTPVDVFFYPATTLETVLSNARFPCIYKRNGCTAYLLFGHTAEHEAFCAYRSLPCPSLPYTTCLWEGPAMQAVDHFTQEHPSLVRQDAAFEVAVTENKQEILMVAENNYAFIIKYSYDAAKMSFNYTVGCFTPNLEEDFCKIRLSYSSDSDYTAFTKGCKCVLYTYNLFDLPYAAVVDIGKYIEILNNPSSILIAVIMPKCKIESEVVKMPSVDYNFLAMNTCRKCHYYLIPPLYDVQDGIICRNCIYACRGTETSNKELEKTLMEQNYPCRWRGCDSVVKGSVIHDHEVECQYRTYRCINLYCNASFNRLGLMTHLHRHNFQYFVNKWVIKFRFLELFDTRYAYTVSQNEIILVSQYVDSAKGENFNKRIHYLQLRASGRDPSQFSANVCYEHDHCKCSKKFIFSKKAEVTFSDEFGFPTCFALHDELTVTISISV